MFDWLNSSVSIFLVLTLAATVLFIWRRRWLKKAYAESWETFHAACTTSTSKTPEAEWITALRASVAADDWKPGLKLSKADHVAQVRSNPSHYDVFGHTDTATPRPEDAVNASLPHSCLSCRNAVDTVESTALRVVDPAIVCVHCESSDPKIAKLRCWLVEGKTLFTVMVFPPVDHEWEKIHECQGVLEEVTEQEAKFRFSGTKSWPVFPDFSIGYDRKRKRPLIRFRERL